MHKSATLLFSLSVLSACGGGGTTSQSVSIDADPVRVFSDSSGVASYVGRSDGEVATGYVIAPELASFLEEFRATSEVEAFDISTLRIVDNGPNTTIRTGSISEEGVTFNLLAAITTAEDAFLLLAEEPTSGLSFLQTAGDQATNIPTSGSASYSGVLGLQDLVFDAEPELGTFTASASFSGSPTISLSGSTTSYDVGGSAVILGGSFASTSVTIIGDGFTIPASMNGDFHGEGANSVGGVIYSNDPAGEFRGGFVGSQN